MHTSPRSRRSGGSLAELAARFGKTHLLAAVWVATAVQLPRPAQAKPAAPTFSAPTGDANLQVPDEAGRRLESAPFDLPSDDPSTSYDPAVQGLNAWLLALGQPKEGESFGALIVRAASLMLGRPYGHTVELPGQEVVDCDVSQFQCESYVESSLAVARCAWMEESSVACFRREVARMRYRHGNINGYGSRLHYFEDWLTDNDTRGVVSLWTARLGGKKMLRSTAYMTDHPDSYPALQDANELRRVAAAEHRLSRRPMKVVMRQSVAAVEAKLQDGDIVAIVTRRPDILVHHAGLIKREADHSVHLLHASSAFHKVMRTNEGIAAYLNRRPERQGILVARPLPPPRRGQAAGTVPAAAPATEVTKHERSGGKQRPGKAKR